MVKSTARAGSSQGLVKYLGLKNPDLRIPYWDSVAVCVDGVSTITTVEPVQNADVYIINGVLVNGGEMERMKAVVDRVREIAGSRESVKVVSVDYLGNNPYAYHSAKGLAYSASAGAALAAAAAKALGAEELVADKKRLSTVARRLSGSSARSTVGGFCRWHTSETDEGSYAEQIAGPQDLPDFSIIVYPVQDPRGLRTDFFHGLAKTSKRFVERSREVAALADEMEAEIKKRNTDRIAWLAEQDSLRHLELIEKIRAAQTPLTEASLELFEALKGLRDGESFEDVERNDGVHAYASWNTGSSIFINTRAPNVNRVVEGLAPVARRIGTSPIVSKVGTEVALINEHLF